MSAAYASFPARSPPLSSVLSSGFRGEIRRGTGGRATTSCLWRHGPKLRRFVGPALVAGALLLVAGQAQANHHACPQVTITPNAGGTSTINVARKNCAPTYVPYPIGGPKSPIISGVNQTVPLYLPGIQTPLVPDLGQSGDIITPPYSDPLNDAGPDLSCLRPNLGTPQGGDPPIPSPGSANDPFPIEYVLRNGNLQLGDGREVAIPTVCAPTVVRSDGRQVYLFADANIKTNGSVFEVLTSLDLLLRGLL